MKRYSQTALLHPRGTLLGGLAAIIVTTAIVAISTRDDLPPTSFSAVPSFAVIAGVLLAIVAALRSPRAILGTLLVVVASTSVVLGVVAAARIDLPYAEMAVLVAALAVVQALHVAYAHRRRVLVERQRPRPLPRDRRYLLSEALRDIRPAIVLTAVVVTLACVLSIAFGPRELRGFAAAFALAAIVTSAASMMLLPAVLAPAPPEVPEHPSDVLSGLARGLARVGTSSPIGTVVLAAALTVGMVVLHVQAGGSWSWLLVSGLALWLVVLIGLGSPVRGALALLAVVPPALLVSLVPEWAGERSAAGAVVGAMLVFAIGSLHVVHVYKAWGGAQERSADRPAAAVEVTGSVAPPILIASLVACAACSMFVIATRDVSWAGLGIPIAIAAAAIWPLVYAPASLAVYKANLRTQPRAEDWRFIEGFDKVTAAEHITSFSEFTDDQIRHMFVGDFFALCGKTVMRHGGTHGTRRLLAELDIRPNARVLEIGTGVGTSAYDLVSADPTIHVTGVDLSAFMVESAKRRLDEQARTWVAQGRGSEEAFRSRLSFVHTRDPNVMPFEDNSFDVVLVEAVASYNDPNKFFPEILRVLKPGGRVGLHDWCWTMEPPEDLEVHVCVIACGCNPGEMKFFTQRDWQEALERQGFEIRFAEQYPFTFFSWGTMADDEGTWPLIKMFARVFSRRAIAQRMMRMMFFLMRHEGAFGYTITVGQKPQALTSAHPERASA